MRPAPRTTSSSSPTAASAAPSPTTSCRPCGGCSSATPPPEHIVIETSGLALPKPLIKAFNWPEIRTRVTVDGVVAVVDAAAVRDGLFADDPDAVAAQRAGRSGARPREPARGAVRGAARLPPTWSWSTRPTCWPTRDWPEVEARVRAGAARRASAWSAPAMPPCRSRCCSASARRPRAISTAPALAPRRRQRTTSTTTSAASTSACRRSTTSTRFVARLRRAIARHPILRVKGFARGRRQADAPGPAGRRRSRPALFRSRLAQRRGARGPAGGDRRARARPGRGRRRRSPAEPMQPPCTC